MGQRSKIQGLMPVEGQRREAGRIATGEDDDIDGVSFLSLSSVVWHRRDGKKHQSNATAAEENSMLP
jgi:hypothetical protein